LGFGKTFFDQTIAILIEKDTSIMSRYQRYLNTAVWRGNRRQDLPTPYTRVVYMEGNAPREVLGWVKLTAL
jgi:hypothetical protein